MWYFLWNMSLYVRHAVLWLLQIISGGSFACVKLVVAHCLLSHSWHIVCLSDRRWKSLNWCWTVFETYYIVLLDCLWDYQHKVSIICTNNIFFFHYVCSFFSIVLYFVCFFLNALKKVPISMWCSRCGVAKIRKKKK